MRRNNAPLYSQAPYNEHLSPRIPNAVLQSFVDVKPIGGDGVTYADLGNVTVLKPRVKKLPKGS